MSNNYLCKDCGHNKYGWCEIKRTNSLKGIYDCKDKIPGPNTEDTNVRTARVNTTVAPEPPCAVCNKYFGALEGKVIIDGKSCHQECAITYLANRNKLEWDSSKPVQFVDVDGKIIEEMNKPFNNFDLNLIKIGHKITRLICDPGQDGNFTTLKNTIHYVVKDIEYLVKDDWGDGFSVIKRITLGR